MVGRSIAGDDSWYFLMIDLELLKGSVGPISAICTGHESQLFEHCTE